MSKRGPRFIDEKGNKYGKLIVVSEAGRDKKNAVLWFCVCDCGGNAVVTGRRLRYGSSQSCGCLNHEPINELGNRYSRLVVVREMGRNKSRNTLWLCECDCGNTTVTTGNALRSGKKKSCGCLVREKLIAYNKKRGLPAVEAGLNKIYRLYKEGAKSRGLIFDLTKEGFKEITLQLCYYCGMPPSQIVRGRAGNYVYNGIDRVDNSCGYIEGNVVSCCKHCNVAKMARTLDDFLEWVARVYDYSIRDREDLEYCDEE